MAHQLDVEAPARLCTRARLAQPRQLALCFEVVHEARNLDDEVPAEQVKDGEREWELG